MGNRKTQSLFVCKSFGLEKNADSNAAINIKTSPDSPPGRKSEKGSEDPQRVGTGLSKSSASFKSPYRWPKRVRQVATKQLLPGRESVNRETPTTTTQFH